MGIARQLETIIQKRKARLPYIEKKLKHMQEILSKLTDLDYIKSQMIDRKGNIKEDGKYKDLLSSNPDMAWKLQGLDTGSCRAAVNAAVGRLEECRERFSRESINISVIGEARRGKSALLKSISGLSSYVIPAFESTDCTGAPSVICNRPGSPLRAALTFKSKEQMRRMAQVYLDRIILDQEKRIVLRTMEDIRGLDLKEVERRANRGEPDGIFRKYLEKMVVHYEEWAPYADRKEALVLCKEEEIASYVAQNNGVPVGEPGRVEYYKYLVVESCEITCSFPQQEAGKINLIDTVGLGDHTLGILESMLETVKDKSDAVIFMIMPQNGAGGGIPQSVKDIYGQIVEICREKELDKWLFYLINHVKSGSSHYASNTPFCRSALEMLRDAGYFGSRNARIIDAIDGREVRADFLVPLLESLAENLDGIDRVYLEQVEKSLLPAKAEYQALCTRVQKVLQSDISRNASMISLMNQLAREAQDTLRTHLFRLMMHWQEKRDQPCPVIYDCAADILDRMTQDMREDTYLPSQEAILEQLNTGIQPSALYIRYANQIRNAISEDFLDVNVQLKEFVEQMKNEIARILCDTCGFGLLYRPEEGKPLFQWLEGFSDSVLGEDEAYKTIRLAIDTLNAFEFSVKGFLTYEVRNCLDLLDPRLTNVPVLVSRNNSLKHTAGNIRIMLLQSLCDIADMLGKVMRELCVKPNRALFAEVIEFYDRLIYAEGVEMEWANFYAEKAGILWGPKIKEAQNISILCQDWLDVAEGMQQLCLDGAFQV